MEGNCDKKKQWSKQENKANIRVKEQQMEIITLVKHRRNSRRLRRRHLVK